MQVHLFPRSDVPRCCDTQNKAFCRALKDLGTISVCKDWSREEAWYLAQQIEEAIVCISMCIIVTDIYAVMWRISCNWSWLIGRRQTCLLLSGMDMEKASCVLSMSRILRFWMDGLAFSCLNLVYRLDLENLSWQLYMPVQPRQMIGANNGRPKLVQVSQFWVFGERRCLVCNLADGRSKSVRLDVHDCNWNLKSCYLASNLT
jgi:hypothetical protein